MAVFKCKMCGGNLEVQEGMSICECEYCGTKQTLPKMNDQRRANLYDRANHFRRNNEFDKAMSMYEQILEEDREDAEAYWSLVLCTYGIEYVEDPTDHTRKPTVNRTQYTSVFADENYKAALKYADEKQRQLYEAEARQIDGIQKGILDISSQEEPFDVFICYKETDAAGQRTQDSVLANDLYHQLTQEGFKVFFARITLEDKLGSAYEPYIFAALNSAKVMVVLGTKPEYFNAVWVRNEWSRYLSLIKGGAKKVLIPAYKDMDPYDLPQEFSHLQSQDMGKLGFMQDLIRGIRKLTGADQAKQTAAAASGTPGNETAALLKRAFLFLEDGDFAKGDEYCERVLNLDPESGEAYLGKLMAQLKIRKREGLAQNPNTLEQEDAYQKVMRFGGDAVKKELEGYNQQIRKRLQEQQEKQREDSYQGALKLLESAVKSSQIQEGINRLKLLGGYKDTAERLAAAAEKLAQLEKKEREERKKRQRKATRIGIVLAAAVVVVAVIASAAVKRNQYNQAVQAAESLLQAGDYDGAYRQFADLTGEEKAKEEVAKAMGDVAEKAVEEGEYRRVFELLRGMSSYANDPEEEATRLGNAMFQSAQEYVRQGVYDKADELLSSIEALPGGADVTEAAARLGSALYQAAQEHTSAGEYEKAEELLAVIGKLPESTDTVEAATQFGNGIYQAALQYVNAKEYAKVSEPLVLLEKIPVAIDTSEAAAQLSNAMYQMAQEDADAGESASAKQLLREIGKLPGTADRSEAATRFADAMYLAVQQCVSLEEYARVDELFSLIGEIPDTVKRSEEGARLAEIIYRTTLNYLKENQNEKAEAPYALMEQEAMAAYRIPIEDTKVELARASVGKKVSFGHTGEYGSSCTVVERNENGEVLLYWKHYDSFSINAFQSSWKDSFIRKWLNTDYLKEHFSAEEQALILTKTIQNESFQIDAEYHVVDEDNIWNVRQELETTEDKLFLPLLSDAWLDTFNKWKENKNIALWQAPVGFYRSSGNVDSFETLLYHDDHTGRAKNKISGLYYLTKEYPGLWGTIDSTESVDGGSGLKVEGIMVYFWVNPYAE
ncbi:MAG: toll/interleukin-1 receptor domain-containing protein [bacterium]|nr:toll/interleukin-1 receptor domain-containing protein [bacterium]